MLEQYAQSFFAALAPLTVQIDAIKRDGGGMTPAQVDAMLDVYTTQLKVILSREVFHSHSGTIRREK